MTSPNPRKLKSGCWVVTLSFLTIAVMSVMVILITLLFDLSIPVNSVVAAPTRNPGLNLPTAILPTATIGPPIPLKARFTPEEPITGFSNCNAYGFRGRVKSGSEPYPEAVQIVIWEEGSKLLALKTIDAVGEYDLQFAGKPNLRKLWLQLYQDDVPVSAPLPFVIQADCQVGFQIYQVDWQISMVRQE